MFSKTFSILLVDKNYDIISASGDYFNLTDAIEEKNFVNSIKEGSKDFISAISDLKKDKYGFCIVEFKSGNKKNKCLLRVKKTKEKRASYEIYLKEINNFYDNAVSSIESYDIIKKIFVSGNCIIFNYNYELDRIVLHSQKGTKVVKLKNHLEYLKVVNPAAYETINNYVLNDKIPNIYVEVNNLLGFNRCSIKGENIFHDGKNVECIGIIEEIDINDEKELSFVGNIDYTTNVLKKEAIVEYAKKLIDVRKNDATIMILDLDDFKDINDNYGHQYGDKYLFMIAEIFKKSVGNRGYVGRIGGDEFMCVIPRCLTIDEIREIARPVRLEVQWISTKENIAVQTSCSIGIARTPIDASTYNDLFSIADKCLYVAKDKGKNKYVFACEESLNYKIEENKQDITRRFRNEQRIEELLNFITGCVEDDDLDGLLSRAKKIAASFYIDRATLYYGEGLKVYKSCGANVVAKSAFEFDDPRHLDTFDEFGYSYIDNTVRYEISDTKLDAYYKKLDIKSAMQHKIFDDNGKFIALVSVEKNATATSWRPEVINYFVIISKSIEQILLRRSRGM